MVYVCLTNLPASSADCIETLGASTYWNLKGLSRPAQGEPYLYMSN